MVPGILGRRVREEGEGQEAVVSFDVAVGGGLGGEATRVVRL